MKQILIALGFLVITAQAQGAEQMQINESWPVEDGIFTMTTEQSYDESRVDAFSDIALNYHKVDLLKSGGDGQEKHLSVHKDFLDLRATQFKNGELSLLL